MGIDARMQVKLATPVTNEQLTHINWRLAGDFHREPFWDKPLSRHKDYETEREDQMTLDVSLLGRYYGPGYERGPLMTYVATAEWLEYHLPGCSILYGGDSDDDLSPFGPVERQTYKDHFFEKGHLPYISGFNEKTISIDCPDCKQPMINDSWSGGSCGFYCYGCSQRAVVNPLKGFFRWDSKKEEHSTFDVFDKLEKGELQYQK